MQSECEGEHRNEQNILTFGRKIEMLIILGYIKFNFLDLQYYMFSSSSICIIKLHKDAISGNRFCIFPINITVIK